MRAHPREPVDRLPNPLHPRTTPPITATTGKSSRWSIAECTASAVQAAIAISATGLLPTTETGCLFLSPNDTFRPENADTLDRARTAWTNVARTIARYELVTVIASPKDADTAQQMLGEDIVVAQAELDDAWLRDSGPTFVHDSDGELVAVKWFFNGWRAQSWAAWDHDTQLGHFVAERAGTPSSDSALVNEGGAFHIDGKGTVLLTDTVQLDPDRNPDATKASVEQEIHARLGTSHAVWLPRGLTRDYEGFGTRGHVDIVTSFTENDSVLLHRQDNPEHPDHEVTKRLRQVLENSVDAQGQPLESVEMYRLLQHSKMTKAG